MRRSRYPLAGWLGNEGREWYLLRPLLLLAMLASSAGCERQTAPTMDSGSGYFPLERGSRLEYEVTETTYAPGRAPVTRTYQLRETVGEKYTDASGFDVYPVIRATRSGQGEWRTDSVWTAWRTKDRALRMENGVPFVKIQFPARERSRWDGNLFNTMEEKLYEITSLNKPLRVGAQSFDKTLTVSQQNDSTLLSLRRRLEIYAENVGMIRSERTSVQYCDTPDCLGKGIVDYGFSQVITVTSYGQ